MTFQGYNYFELLAFYNYDSHIISTLFESFRTTFPEIKNEILHYLETEDHQELGLSLQKLKSGLIHFRHHEAVEIIDQQERALKLSASAASEQIHKIIELSEALLLTLASHQKKAA